MGKFDSGTVSVQINGRVINVKGSVTYSTHQEKVTTFRGADGHAGGKIELVNPYIEVLVTDSADINTQEFQNLENAQVVLNQRNGKIITFSDCRQVNQVEVDAIEGELTLRFEALGGSTEQTV